MRFPLFSSRSIRSLWPFILIAASFIFLAIPAFIFGGVTWDELFDFEGVNGAFWHGINTIKGLNPDISTITFDLEYFGNATRWPTYLFWRLLGTSTWESFSGLSRQAVILSGSYVGLNHLNAVIFGFLGIVILALIGRQLGGRRLAICSAILLAILPTWLGHSWMNSKDVPFATSYLTYTYGSTLLFDRGSCKSSGSLFSAPALLRIVGIGMLLGSRIGSLPFIALSECFYLVWLRRTYIPASLSVLLGLCLGYLVTPQAWNDPFGYPIKAIRFIGERQTSDSPVGTLAYIAFHLYESLPLLILVGLGVALFSWLFRPNSLRGSVEWMPVLLQMLIAPVLLIAGSKSLYNELRHILFIYPSICMVSAYGWIFGFERIFVRGFARYFSSLLALMITLLLALENVSLAPYQYVYRSDLARLLSPGYGVHRDYWGFSVRETTARCLKNSPCSTLMSKVPYHLRPGDWNRDLFIGLRELLQYPNLVDSESANSQLEVQISPSLDACKSIVETTRMVFLPTPSRQLISRVASCS